MRGCAGLMLLVLSWPTTAGAQRLPCGSELAPVEAPSISGDGMETLPGERRRYRYDRRGRLLEQRIRVLAAVEGAPAEGREQYGYDRHGHLTELRRWDGVVIYIDRSASGQIERFRLGREGRMARQWVETRVQWQQPADSPTEALRHETLTLWAWSPRQVRLVLALLDGGRPGRATTERFSCRASGGSGRRRPANAVCERDATEPGTLTYDDRGRLVDGTLRETLRSIRLQLEYSHDLPALLRETQTTQSDVSQRVTTLSFGEDEHLVAVDFGEGRDRRLRWEAGRVVELQSRRRPAVPEVPDRVTRFHDRCH